MVGVQKREGRQAGACPGVSFCLHAGLGYSCSTFSCKSDNSTRVFPCSGKQGIESVQFCLQRRHCWSIPPQNWPWRHIWRNTGLPPGLDVRVVMGSSKGYLWQPKNWRHALLKARRWTKFKVFITPSQQLWQRCAVTTYLDGIRESCYNGVNTT